jgi:hypothetical protein
VLLQRLKKSYTYDFRRLLCKFIIRNFYEETHFVPFSFAILDQRITEARQKRAMNLAAPK